MKNFLILLFAGITILLSQHSCSEYKPDYAKFEHARDSILQIKDTAKSKIIYKDINLDSLNYIDSVKNHLQNEKLAQLQGVSLIQYLRSSCIYQHDNWRVMNKFGMNDSLISIPYAIYKKIFPDTTYYYNKTVIKKGESTYGIGDTIIRRYGTEINFQPHYYQFFSFIEKPEYIQLIVTSEGKYVSSLNLWTFSKPEVKPISVLPIYDSFCDAGDIDVHTPRFSINKDTVELKHLFNSTEDWEKVDSTISTYLINQKGKIIKLK